MRICSHCDAPTDTAWCALDGYPSYRRVKRRVGELADGALIAGTWRVTGVLGRGGFATVYDARCEGTGKGVAVKVLRPPPQSARDEVLARFQREAQASAQLAHPNTVLVFEHGELPDGRLFLAMERLPGESLHVMLSSLSNNGAWLAPQHAVQIAISVLRSLTEAHGLGLVHRDLKPGNIFMVRSRGGDWTPKVLDFGLVQAPGARLTRAGQALGTPWYMSPEQVRGEQVDGRSDLYALGAVLYECLAGRPPFVSSSAAGVLLQHLDAEPVPLFERAGGRIPAALADVVDRALRKKPDARWPDAAAMRAALEAILPTLEAADAPPGTAPLRPGPATHSEPRRGTAAYGVALGEDETMDAIEVPEVPAEAPRRPAEQTRKLAGAEFAAEPPPPPARPRHMPSTHRAVQQVDLEATEAAPAARSKTSTSTVEQSRDELFSGPLRLHFARTDPRPNPGARRRKHLAITGKPGPKSG